MTAKKQKQPGGAHATTATPAEGFAPLLGALRQLIADSRQQVLRAVDVVQVQTCWHVGRHIVEFEQGGAQGAAYGQRLLPQLGQALSAEFGRGFDATNLRHMRGFYQAFPIRDALRRELSWTHYRLLLRVDSAEARQWYVQEAAAQNWSTRALERQIGSLYYERLLLSQDKAAVSTEAKANLAALEDSLLLNVRKKVAKAGGSIGKIFGQEKNITTYNLARMNMLLHGVKDTEFEIFHGDTLLNEWDMMREQNPARKPSFDAIVANPPFSYRWEPTDALADDVRFKSHGLAPKSAADFAFLLHGFHFLKDEGVMAIILPHGVLFRGGAEERIRKKLLNDGHIDTVIGLPANLFHSTGIPVCILVLKKCKKPDDVLFINAAEHFVKGKRQNQLTGEHIAKIIKTYQSRDDVRRYSRKVEMAEIEKNDFNLNIPRYISTAVGEAEIDLDETHQALVEIEKAIAAAKDKHNAFLRELDLKPLP